MLEKINYAPPGLDRDPNLGYGRNPPFYPGPGKFIIVILAPVIKHRSGHGPGYFTDFGWELPRIIFSNYFILWLFSVKKNESSVYQSTIKSSGEQNETVKC